MEPAQEDVSWRKAEARATRLCGGVLWSKWRLPLPGLTIRRASVSLASVSLARGGAKGRAYELAALSGVDRTGLYPRGLCQERTCS